MIQWQSYTKSAFDKAKRAKKPILLCISATWCHWCHTMERLTYSNDQIAEAINGSFVPIRVDTDARPDINERYNVGGWPSTIILANDGEPVSGATYVSPEHMLAFLDDAIRRYGTYVPKNQTPAAARLQAIDPADFHSLVESFYDPINGGFGLEPKFPHADILQYLIWRIGKSDDAESARMLDKTLMSMLDGELFDHVGGGFFRYATVQNWTIPHFEKMLDDNARLLSSYVAGYRFFKRKEYLLAINKTLFFMQTTLFDRESGLFCASQDADEEYCSLPLERRVKVKHPFIDQHKYADSNALAIIALLDVSAIEPEYRRMALAMLKRAYARFVDRGVSHTKEEAPLYLLRDAVNLLHALIRAYALTQEPDFKTKAIVIARHLTKFEDKKEGGFFDILKTNESVGRLAERKKPVNENAMAALALSHLARLTKDRRFANSAMRALESTASDAWMLGAYGVLWALAKIEIK